jgi:Uma2 family endonuclease
LRVVPNLVCEILSPDSERRDRVEKLEIYAEAGIDEYWTIDLSRRRIRIHHLTPDGVYDAGEEFACGQRLRSRVLPRLRCLVDPLVSYPA